MHSILLRAALALFILGLVPVPALQAQTLPDQPVLRIETGMHDARITSVDAAAGLVLTGSNDKTGRIWDARTGALLRTLRVPVGGGFQGQVRAGALSPDGRIAVLGGNFQYGRDSTDIFVFDVATGRMLRRLPGARTGMTDMHFSPAGDRLAAVSYGGEAVVLETDDWTELARRDDLGEVTRGVAWSADNTLAAVGDDGILRQFDADLNELARADVGMALAGVAFSPDGRRLAVARYGAPPLIFDARNLSAPPLDLGEWDNTVGPDQAFHRPDDDVWRLAFVDDEVLLGAGRIGRNLDTGDGVRWREVLAMYHVRHDGVLDFDHLPTDAKTTILDIALVRLDEDPSAAAVVTVGAEPDMGLVDGYDSTVWYTPSPNLTFRRDDRSHLRLSPDGHRVGATPLGGAPFVFDVAARQLRDAQSDDPHFREAAGDMAFSDWLNNPAPRLNGQPLDHLLTGSGQVSRSVDVAADGSFGVLASDFNLHALNPDGSVRWRTGMLAEPWTVKIADAAPLVVMARNDGTLRWVHSETGAGLLSLYVHADRTRWVMWTPSGYYDASPGGEELIGWAFNRGLDQAPDFFPAYVFRDRFYRPDVVAEILTALDEDEALARADARSGRAGPAPPPLAEALPPVIRIRAPERDSPVAGDVVTLKLDITTPPDAPLTEVSARVNGRVVPDVRTEGDAITLPLPPVDDAELYVTLLAANRHGLGPPVDLRLARPPETAPAPADLRPNLYVLAIGVSKHRDATLDLTYAAKDATEIAEFFAAQQGALYSAVEVRLLTDADATMDGILDGLDWLEREVTARDTAKIFIAGHGVNDNRGNLHFLPHEADIGALRRTALSSSRIVETLQYLPGRVIYLMDTCHSGNLDVARRGGVALDVNGHLQDLMATTGAVVFSSATGSQYALESPAWGNGAFTLAVLEALRGAGDIDGNDAIYVTELEHYVSNRVKELTANQQTPVMQKPGAVADFPLAMLR